tara:strand:- start:1562 stop:2002 length:441 start_codon:yes stop_codon:yes gene_type:complete
MNNRIQSFGKFTKLNESIADVTGNVEVKEYKVKDKHKAEDRLGELGIEWNDLIDHPDGTGFGTDGNLMAHYDEDSGMLYVHVDPSNIEIPSDEQIDKNRDFEDILKRYNSEMDIDADDDSWYKEDEDSDDEEPSDNDISNVSFDDF